MVAPEAKYTGVICLLLQPEGQGLADHFSAGDAPLAAEAIQLLAGWLGEVDDREHGGHKLLGRMGMTSTDADDVRMLRHRWDSLQPGMELWLAGSGERYKINKDSSALHALQRLHLL